MRDWYENDDFWRELSPLLFDEARAGSAPQQVDCILRLLELEPPSRILDLCCGPGRHAVEFARRGLRVVGVDRTRTYLETARRKAAEAGVEAEFVNEDMRAFRCPDAFDAAVNLFTSFAYFETPGEDRRVVDNLFASLRPGGRVLMEMMGKEILARIYQERDWRRLDNDTLLLEERKLLGGWEAVETRWTFIRGSQRKEFTVKLRLYSGAELAALLREAGFQAVNLYGSLDGKPYDQNAQRLVITARK